MPDRQFTSPRGKDAKSVAARGSLRAASLAIIVAAANMVLFSQIAAADEPSGRQPAVDATVTAVLLAPARPVLVRLDVQIDGKPVGAYRQAYCDEWFSRLDKNEDGALDATEIGGITPAPPAQNAASQDWQQFDADPKDSKLSLDEFRAFANAVLGPPVAVIKQKRKTDDAASLFRRLDINQDGALSVDELQKARESLAFLDADDDETISVAELNNAPEKAETSAAASTDVPPILVLGPECTSANIAEQLLQCYDAKTSNTRDGALDPIELGCATEAISPFDADGNQKLDAAELARMVVEAPPELTFAVVLFDQDRGRPSLAVASTSPSSKFDVKQIEPDTCTLGVDALEITLVARRTRSSTGDSRRYYAVRFKLSDKDLNGYLDATEFATLKLKDATLEAVDADKNGQVTSDELVNFVSKEDAVRMNQVVLEAADVSRPLFDFLDVREDRRLSARELMSAASRLSQIDGNKDGKITPAELMTRLDVDVSVKRPASARADMGAPSIRSRQAAAAVPRDRGPQWFLRMDRNYDGDVSWREFLGPRAVFDRLDADHDGLLSPDEADAAK